LDSLGGIISGIQRHQSPTQENRMGWSDKAVTNISKMIMIRQYSRDKGEKYWKEKLDGLVKSQGFVIFSILHLMISMGYEPGFFKF